MYNRNFIQNNPTTNQNQNQNRMPQNFGALGGFNSMRNMPPRRDDFGGQQQQQQPMPQLGMQQFPPNQQRNQSQQLGMGPAPMFFQDRFNNNSNSSLSHCMQRLSGGQHFQNQGNLTWPNRESAISQGQFNRGPLDTPQGNVRQFNRSPDRGQGPLRGQLNRSPERPLGMLRGTINISPERGPGLLRGPFNNSSEGGRPGVLRRLLNKSPERGLGFLNEQQLSSRSPGRKPELYRRQHSRSPDCAREFGGGRRSRSPVRGMRRLLSPSPPRRQDSPQHGLSRELSPPPPRQFRRDLSPGPRRSPLPPRGNGNNAGTWRPMVNLSRPQKRELSRNENELRRQRQKREPNIPSPGQPGGKGDPNRRNLSGSRTKWYVRYLKKGFHPDEALRMAREPVQPAANYLRGPVDDLPVDEQLPSCESPREDFAHNNERQASSRSPERDERNERNPNEMTVSLMPVGYPNEKLSHQEKLDLEEAILQEVVMAGASAAAPLRFSSIHFKAGFLKVDCSNQATADWLVQTAEHIYSYKGRPVVPKLGDPKSKFFYITIFLPRSEGKSDEFLLGLIRSQNKYNTDLWKIVSRKAQAGGTLLVLSIDKTSATDIAANDYAIFYRYGTVPVRGLRKRFGDKSPPRPSNRAVRNSKATPLKPVKQETNSTPQKPNPVVKDDPVEEPEDSPLCINLASDDEGEN
ncbi:serine/arginine repetitive matrix protein 1-like [Drosophila novamexicana]|uniref:serine/arginine repetitive matrix protein 1-like n=1 Tax=Drosophila novamexicana TaxID=47314 RepID=UPI0011E5D728|nr:serine/arginine repetitive matrix protein 1-like [Drosophila novamexicana]